MKNILSLVVVSLLVALPSLQAQCVKGNCQNGQGTYVYPSGARYVGDFVDGKIEGQGVLYFSNGNRYVGTWKNQFRDGKGKMIFSNGDVYRGHFKRSRMEGRGTMEYANGDKYKGKWENDLPHGKGVYTFAGGNIYEGNMVAGKFNGQGVMKYTDGSKYTGSWKNNYKDGQGTLTDANGKEVEGLWLAGKIVNNEEVATAEDKPDELVVENELRNCNDNFCQDGLGVYTYRDGSKWIGEFYNGKPEGQGTCYYVNGDKYVGNWKRHAPHGEGVMYFSSGKAYGAIWEYGKSIREMEANQDIVEEKVEVEYDNEIKVWAVVVGVARYAHMPVLKYTDDDAYQIYAFLKSPEGGALRDNQMRVLIDEDATRENIIKAMRSVFLKADDNDVVLLYFSGHGLPGSFLPVDFDGFNNKLQHDELQGILRESKAKHKLCLADACHSGTLTAMRSSAAENSIKKFYEAFAASDGGTALLLSSKGDEFSLEDHGLRQGIFSHFLIRGLKGEADGNSDKIVTISELFDFVYTKVRAYTGNVQTPTLSGEFDETMPVAVIR